MSLSADCRVFVRDLADHLEALAAGRLPAHASRCAPCERRLRLAAGLAGLASQRPAMPAGLDHPSVLAAIHARAAEQLAQAPIGSLVRQVLAEPVGVPQVGPPAATGADWPLQRSEPELDDALRRLGEAADPAPGWLWLRIRHDVRTRAVQRFRRRAAFAGAAALLLTAVLLSRAGGVEPQPDVRIVYETLREMPLVEHPTAILRRGGGR